MHTRAKERSLPLLGQLVTTTKWGSRSWPPAVARPGSPAFLHEVSFLPAWLVLAVPLQAAARLQLLAFDWTRWLQFPGSVPLFSFSVSALSLSRPSPHVPEDLLKSRPAHALTVH